MRIAFAILVGIHGLLHLLGPAKAFGLAEVQQLVTPVSPLGGVLWRVAAVLLVSAAIGFALGAHRWWWLGLPGMVLSQVLITPSWSDAKFGTIPNLVIAIPLLLLPHVGQGANQATEDGVALATILAQADRALCPDALRVYESVRRERTAGVQAMSRANRTRYEASSDLDARDQQLGSQAVDRAWIWNYDAEAEAAAVSAAP